MKKLGQQLQEKHVQHWNGAAFTTCIAGMVQPLSRAALEWCSLYHVQHWNGAAFITCSTGIVEAIRTCSAGVLQHWGFAALTWRCLQHVQRWGGAAFSTCRVGVVQPSALAELGWCSLQHLQRWGGATFSTCSVGVVQPSALAALGWCNLQHCSPSASIQRHGRNVAAALSGKEGGVRWGRWGWGGVTHGVHGCLCVKVKCSQPVAALRKRPVCQVKLPEGHTLHQSRVLPSSV